MDIDSIKSKSAPAYMMVYNTGEEIWETMGQVSATSVESGLLDFKGAPCPQKGAASYMFVYDETIEQWRPANGIDIGGELRTASVQKTIIPAGSESIELGSYEEEPSFMLASISRPDADSELIFCSPRYDGSGVVADFSAAITGSGYYINYIINE